MVVVLMLPALAAAQAYPTRPVRFIVPSAPGGGTDIVTRAVAQKLSESMGQAFAVENRAGAANLIGVELVQHSAPDGYTIIMSPSTITVLPFIQKVSYDLLRDFAPISLAAAVPNILVVHPSVAAKSVAELVALSKREPGKLSYASAGAGSSPHMSVELFKNMAGIDIVHIPYKGTAPGVVDLLAGRVQVMMGNVLTLGPHIRAGKLRALGVSSAKRSEAVPDVPPIGESVSGYDVIQWYGMFAPAGTPRPAVARLSSETARALRLPEVKERLAADGAEPVGNTPEEFTAHVRAELEKWSRVARAANIRAD
jgi:tripartite-type tricarboxylate transporter receptor subunit TctC